MVPQPVKAVVLLFPISKPYEEKRKAEDAQIAKEGQHPIDTTILWIRQTVRGVVGIEFGGVLIGGRFKMRVGRWASSTL